MKICEYGCEREAKYQFKNGKWCCSKSQNSCPELRRKNSESNSGKNNPFFGKTHTKESIEKNRKSNKGKEPWNKNLFLSTIEHLENKYPFFSQIEGMRYNPYKPGEKEIQVHCKNHLCPNSKEKDGWFTPTRGQLGHRIDALENPRGFGESNFYCSQYCKDICPIYYSHGTDLSKNTEKPYIQAQYNTFIKEVLERQRIRDKYNSCEKCESTENLHVHHEKPVKTHPHLALDPDNGIVLCQKCHYKYGHKTGTECSTGNLANLQCN